MRKTWILIFCIVSMLALAACGNNDMETGSEENATEDVSLDIPEPDLTGIPDIVAVINGEEITKEQFTATYEQQFQQAFMQAQLLGQEIDQNELKQSIAEGMVGQALLTQEANKRFANVSEEEVNKTMDSVAEQNGLENKEALIKAFEQQGMSKEQLVVLIENQVKIDQLLAEETGEIEPTEQELQTAYDAMKTQLEQFGSDEELPSFDEMKEELVAEVTYQKEIESMQSLVDKLKNESDVTIHI